MGGWGSTIKTDTVKDDIELLIADKQDATIGEYLKRNKADRLRALSQSRPLTQQLYGTSKAAEQETAQMAPGEPEDINTS